MGAWGTKIFQDDLAQDIKETYIDLLKQGKKNEEITQKLIEKYANNLDKDEISVFWFALADIQWDYGRLLDNVKEKALSYIKSGEDRCALQMSNKNKKLHKEICYRFYICWK